MPTLAGWMSQLEELWSHCDTVLNDLSPADWPKKFGRHWTYMDVPCHLAYMDLEIIAEGIKCGPAMPARAQVFMHTPREFNSWNTNRLAEYRRDQTVEQSLRYLRAGRAAIREAVAPLSDADLDCPVWFPLTGFAGWRTVGFALERCRQHTWAHFMQLRLRLNRKEPVVSPIIVHGALSSMIRSLRPLVNARLAQRTQLTTALRLTGKGGGVWTIQVANSDCTITEGAPVHADLTLALSPETFIEILSEMRSPLMAVLTGRIRVYPWQLLSRFLKLFPRPHPDQALQPVP